MSEELELLTPSEYFEKIKESKQEFTLGEKELRVYRNAVGLLEKAIKMGQTDLAKNLMFQVDTLTKEMELVDLGKNTYITRTDISSFIEKAQRKHLALVQLKDYPREVPDEVVAEFDVVRDIFDDYYVLFTDYTGEIRKGLENDKERKDKDPILFGIFKEGSINKIHERFYVIGSWEDEYCDLTLEKLLEESRETLNKNILQTSPLPTVKQLKFNVQQMSGQGKKARSGNWKQKVSDWLRGK